MLKSLIKTIVLLVSLVWAGAACAVGFGTANVQSALGEPLRVEISLISVSEADRMGLTARLASPDNFKAVGLEYPYHLSKLKFEIVDRNNRTYILVTSREVVTDSFINLLVELNWKAGKLMREYTFLLDPPDYQAQQPKTEDVTPIEPAVVAVPATETPQVAPLAPTAAASAPGVGAASEVEAAPSQANVAAESSVAEAGPAGVPAAASATAETITPVPETAAAGGSKTSPGAMPAERPGMLAQTGAGRVTDRSGETIKVKRGDTLSTIAKRMQEPDVTLEQMLVGLYRANIKQFDGRNMNRIRAGKILKMPEPEVFENLSQKAAVREIRIQTENWNAYRQKLAAAGTTVPAQLPKQEVGGKISTSVADLAPKPKEQPNGKLVLSHGETPGDKTAPGAKGLGAEAAKAQQAKEDAIAREKAAQDEKMRIAELEKLNQNMKNRIALQGTAPAAASSVAPGSAVAQASGVASASAVRPMPKAAPPVSMAEKSIVDDIVDTIFENDTMKGLAADYPMIKDPIVLGGGLGGVILLVGGGIFMLRRRGGGGGRTKKKKLTSRS